MAGIYIHIPFCRQRCHYCNFHFSTSLRFKEELIHAILKEISFTSYFTGHKEAVDTVYFGGGTPSLLSITEVQRLLSSLHQKFTIAPEAEITLEANPDDISTASLQQWKSAGINRLSVGIQSFNDAELTWMNRAHSAAESLHCINLITEAGIQNFSVDLIYGSPLLDTHSLKATVETLLQKKVPHISCYALTVEPKTPLAKKVAEKKTTAPDAGLQAEQFMFLMQWMKQAGYEHYEISNYALPGMRSRHNSSYWQGCNYYGFGPSAHSYNGAVRRWNIANNAVYIKSINEGIIPFEEEVLSITQQVNEYIMTALRTAEGVNGNLLKTVFGEHYYNTANRIIEKYINTGKVYRNDDFLILTNEGKLFADGIAADMFF